MDRFNPEPGTYASALRSNAARDGPAVVEKMLGTPIWLLVKLIDIVKRWLPRTWRSTLEREDLVCLFLRWAKSGKSYEKIGKKFKLKKNQVSRIIWKLVRLFDTHFMMHLFPTLDEDFVRRLSWASPDALFLNRCGAFDITTVKINKPVAT